MPTNRKRVARHLIRNRGITEADYIYFSFGDFFQAEGYADGKTEAELKAFWKAHREVIMQRFLEENRLKGWKAVRPWAFWKWDMEMIEPRKETPPGEFDSPKVWDHRLKIYGCFETDFFYLKRLGLLEDWEIERLKE